MADATLKLKVSAVARLAVGGAAENSKVVLLLAAFFVWAPNVVMALIETGLRRDDWTIELVDFAVTGLMAVVASLGVLYALDKGWNGESVRLSDAVSAAMRRFWPAVLIGIVWALGVGLGLVLLVVPGLMLAAMWYVVQPVVAVEPWKGVGYALDRSRNLTKGHRWTVFLLLLLTALGGALAGGLIGFVVGFLAPPSNPDPALKIVSAPLIQAVVTPFWAAVSGATRRELIRIKEGGGVASLFD